MTDNAESVLLTDGKNRVRLYAPQLYANGPGFEHRVDFVGGPFQGAIEARSYEGPAALLSFRDGLAVLCEGSKGEARLPNTYLNLRMSLTGDGLGHIAVQVEAHAVVPVGARVTCVNCAICSY